MDYTCDDIDIDVPVITLEVVSKDHPEKCREERERRNKEAEVEISISERSIVPRSNPSVIKQESEVQTEDGDESYSQTKYDLFEYMMRGDGSVTCKMCGEVLRSRTHWYRHKYKVHVVPNNMPPTSLYQCDRCLVFFKSKKGYIGHLATKHNETTNECLSFLDDELKEEIVETQPDIMIPSTTTSIRPPTPKAIIQKVNEVKRYKPSFTTKGIEIKDTNWAEKRLKEEKLVADIIARVKKECEAQADGGSALAKRKNYARRTSVIN